MISSQSCIILKPTPYFLSFINDQLPDLSLPTPELGVDNTAYTIPHIDDDELLMTQIERFYPFMFEHEAKRILGKDLAALVSADFVDFLFCFKFELHRQPELLETAIEDCHELVCVKPRTINFESMPSEDPIMVEDVQELLYASMHPKTVLVKAFNELEIQSLLEKYCRPVSQADSYKKSPERIQWSSDSSSQQFDRYFAVKVHSQVVHLH